MADTVTLGGGGVDGYFGKNPDWSKIKVKTGRTIWSSYSDNTLQAWLVEDTNSGGVELAGGNYANPIQIAGNGLPRIAGYFVDGFVFENPNQVGIDASGNSWQYVGTSPLPYTVVAGTDPTASSDYELAFTNDHNNLANRNAVGAHDAIYSRKVNSVSDLRNLEPSEGDGQLVRLLGHTQYGIGGGIFRYDASDTTTADDNGMTIVTTGGARWKRRTKGRVTIEAFGAIPNTDSSSAIRAAIAYGACFVPSKRYIYDGVNVTTHNADVKGEQMPVINAGLTALESGSIIEGTFRFTGRNPRVENLGVDHGSVAFGTTGGDALVFASATPNAQSMAKIKNVIGLCTEVESQFHAILCEGHTDTELENLIGIYGFFGCALKNTRNNLSGFIGIKNGSDNLIVKSDTVSGEAFQTNLSNLVCMGAGNGVSPNTGFNLRVISFDEDIEHINISNMQGSTASNGIYIDSRTTGAKSANAVNLSNINLKDNATGLLIDGGTDTGIINDLKLNNVSIVGATVRAGEIKGNVRSLKIDNLYGSLLPTASITTAFTIDSNVRSVMIDDFELVQSNNWTTSATLVIDSNYTGNKLGKIKCDLAGAGIPRPGYSSVTTSGTDITVTPSFDSSHWSSLIAMSHTTTTSINQIVRGMTSGARFPYNYKLTFVHNGTGTLTIKHNPAGFIFNNGSVDLTLLPNETASYVFLNAVWHQV